MDCARAAAGFPAGAKISNQPLDIKRVSIEQADLSVPAGTPEILRNSRR
jgi:hypothetical protein